MSLRCFFGRHKYYVVRLFSPWSRQVGCRSCDKLWAMNDDTRSFLEWGTGFESLYRTIGAWPGIDPNTKKPFDDYDARKHQAMYPFI